MLLVAFAPRRTTVLALGLAAVLVAGRADAAQPALERGRVVRSLPTLTDARQTYAYYLPSGYEPSRKWPILYCFDPMARGWLPVELFAPEAERLGYLLVGSNNSRNGPLEIASVAAAAVWDDTLARLAIDGSRVYATGFSGGSRVASQFGKALKIAGVIGAGAGFGAGVSPSADLPFAWFGIIGRDDFNFFEMTELANALSTAGATAHLEVFEGGHEWPPRDVAGRALEWMDVRAMRAHSLPLDAERVERFAADARARLALAPRESYDRYRLLRTTVDDLRALTDVSDLETELRTLSGSKAIEKAARRERQQKQEQIQDITVLSRLEALDLGLERSTPRDPGALDDDPALSIRHDLEGRLRFLVARATAKEPGEKRTMARRTLYGFSVSCSQGAQDAQRANQLELALGHWSWVAASRPAAPGPRVQMAILSARKGDTDKALRLLGEALDRGYADIEALESGEDFAPLRKAPGFAKLVEKARATRP